MATQLKKSTVLNSDSCGPVEWGQRSPRKREAYNEKLLQRNFENTFIFQSCFKGEAREVEEIDLANMAICNIQKYQFSFCFDVSAVKSFLINCRVQFHFRIASIPTCF